MTFRDRARDPIGLLIAVLIGLLLGAVLAVGGSPVAWAILAGIGLAVVLFALNMAFVRTTAPKSPPAPPQPADPGDPADPEDPAGKAIAMLRRSADSYANIVSASIAVREPANAGEVTSLVTVSGEVIDLVVEYTALVATDQRRGIDSDTKTEQALTLLERGEYWLTSAATALDQGSYGVLDDHVQSLRATRTDLNEGVHQHTESRKGNAGDG
jgi:hypothetical protein